MQVQVSYAEFLKYSFIGYLILVHLSMFPSHLGNYNFLKICGQIPYLWVTKVCQKSPWTCLKIYTECLLALIFAKAKTCFPAVTYQFHWNHLSKTDCLLYRLRWIFCEINPLISQNHILERLVFLLWNHNAGLITPNSFIFLIRQSMIQKCF